MTRILEVFKTDEPVIDQWTFVLDETNPLNGCYTMIATDNSGFGFSQFCEGQYEPGGDNSHLGERPRYMPEGLLNHVLERLVDE